MPAEVPRPERDEALTWLDTGPNIGPVGEAHIRRLLRRAEQAERRIAELDHECQASMAEIARGRERAEEAERLAGDMRSAIRELRLADGAVCRNADGAELRWDRALHAVCALERAALTAAAEVPDA